VYKQVDTRVLRRKFYVREALIRWRLHAATISGGEPLGRPARGPVFVFFRTGPLGSPRGRCKEGLMKKLLFLTVCALLLLFAVAGPALADTAYVVSPFEPAPVAIDPSLGTAKFVDAIPAGSQVFFGYSWRSLNRGLAATAPYASRMRLSVVAPDGTVVGHCNESDCQGFWGPLFRWNEALWGSPEWWDYPYNPKAAAAGMWARDWRVPCGKLPAGEYTCTYNDMLIRAVADPMWEQPGSYPPVYPAYDWPETPMVFTFEVTTP
jgi:hypothetical protein